MGRAEITYLQIESAFDLTIGVLGKADAARLGCRFQPRGDVDAVAHEVAVALLDYIAEMNANPELDALLGRHAGVAAALKDNGGGRLITSEFEPSKAARARDNLKAGGIVDLVEIREGDALKTLSVDLPEAIDLVLLDGAKALYPEILSLVESHLKVGALIVADNADMSPNYLKRVRSPASGYMSVPFAEDVELSRRL